MVSISLRFRNTILVTLLIIASLSTLNGVAEGFSEKELSAIAERSKSIEDKALNTPVPSWLRTNPHAVDEQALHDILKQSTDIVDQAMRGDSMAGSIPENAEESPDLVIFASFSIPETELKALFESSRHRPSMIVFRGLPEGETFGQFAGRLKRIAEGMVPTPNVTINPKLFREWDIDVVPTMVAHYNDKRRSEVRGSYAYDWFLEKASEDDVPGIRDFGKYGDTYKILEPDLIEVMKTRLAAIDWDAKKKNAMARFWKKRTFITLPVATRDNTFYVDPTIHVTKDIVAPDGSVIAFSGTEINPFDQFSFNRRIVVFDGTSTKQTKFVQQKLEDWSTERLSIVLISTQTDRDDGWETLSKLEKRFNRPVYLLNNDMLNRFRLKAIPAEITSDGDRFVIREFKPI